MNTIIPKYSVSIIGGTIYFVENAVSKKAKESAYNKIKRMIINDVESADNGRKSSQKSNTR